MKRYSIAHLLNRQPKTLKKNSQYPLLIDHYNTSEKLKRTRITRRCYNLLNRAVIKPEHLQNFYRTYRLPKDPFFPLFFKIKRDYLNHREELKKKRISYITKAMKSLPLPIFGFIKFLAEYEKQLNLAKRYPLWSEYLFPKTKKRVNEYSSYSFTKWADFFHPYMKRLSSRYKNRMPLTSNELIAMFILQCEIDSRHIKKPAVTVIKKQYRTLSLKHHPDTGGDPEMFKQILWAKDVLLK